MSRMEHRWRTRLTAGAVGTILGVTAPYVANNVLDRFGGDHHTEIRPEKSTITYEAVRELGFLQLLQRDMKGDFRLAALEHYKFPIVDWHYDPSPKVIGQVQDFKADGQSYTVVDFKDIQITRNQVNVDGKMVEAVEAVLPPVKIGGTRVTMLDDGKNPKNGVIDFLSQRGNMGDKIKGKDMFNLADRDFRQKALEDEVLRRASEEYARQIIAKFEEKHGFKFIRVRFADPNTPTLEVSEVALSDGVEVKRRLVDTNGVPIPLEDIETIIARANEKIEGNKKQNNGKYVPTTTIPPHILEQARGRGEHQP
jgi:hypothetical protein